MNGAFDNYIGNEKHIPTTNSRRNFSKNDSNLRQRGGNKYMSKEGEQKLVALENLYFSNNVGGH